MRALPSASLGEGTLVCLCYAGMVEPVERHVAVLGGIQSRGAQVQLLCRAARVGGGEGVWFVVCGWNVDVFQGEVAAAACD